MMTMAPSPSLPQTDPNMVMGTMGTKGVLPGESDSESDRAEIGRKGKNKRRGRQSSDSESESVDLMAKDDSDLIPRSVGLIRKLPRAAGHFQ